MIRSLKKAFVLAYQVSVITIMPSENLKTSVAINNNHLLLKCLDSCVC